MAVGYAPLFGDVKCTPSWKWNGVGDIKLKAIRPNVQCFVFMLGNLSIEPNIMPTVSFIVHSCAGVWLMVDLGTR